MYTVTSHSRRYSVHVYNCNHTVTVETRRTQVETENENIRPYSSTQVTEQSKYKDYNIVINMSSKMCE